jgi:hypothetical protein
MSFVHRHASFAPFTVWTSSSRNFHFFRTYGTGENHHFKLGPHSPYFPGELHFVKLVRVAIHTAL